MFWELLNSSLGSVSGAQAPFERQSVCLAVPTIKTHSPRSLSRACEVTLITMHSSLAFVRSQFKLIPPSPAEAAR